MVVKENQKKKIVIFFLIGRFFNFNFDLLDHWKYYFSNIKNMELWVKVFYLFNPSEAAVFNKIGIL